MWKGESQRHSASRRGLRTKNYLYPNRWSGPVDHAFVNEGSPEWDYMWAKLAELPLNAGISDPTTAEHNLEVWEYMGTYENQHSFRHRNHPKTGKREYVYIPAKERPVTGILQVY